MFSRILTVSIAAATLTLTGAYAQTGSGGYGAGGTSSPSTSAPGTASPGTATPGTATPGGSTGSGTGSSTTSPGMTGSSGAGATGMGATAPNQAQSSGSPFNPSGYKTKTECLNAAQLAGAPREACNSVKGQ